MRAAIRAELGGRIRRARRERLGVSLEGFGRRVAETVGRSRAFSSVTASNWETRRQEPSWEALVAIARVGGVPLEYLAGVGDLADYPTGAGARGARPDPELRTLVAALQRCDPAAQRLAVRQLEGLLALLHEQRA